MLRQVRSLRKQKKNSDVCKHTKETTMNITLSNNCYEKTLTAVEFQFLSGCIKKTQWKVVYVQKKLTENLLNMQITNAAGTFSNQNF